MTKDVEDKHRFAMAIYIDRKRYTVLLSTTDSGNQATLHKMKDGKVYTVDWNAEHESCSCENFVYKHQGHGTRCKHLVALAEFGVLPKISPERRVFMPPLPERRFERAR